jgi:hypothetical protein
LLSVALLAGVAIWRAGASLPHLAPVLVLVGALALAVNRMALFPSEWSATAEAAVIVAAVVSMASDAALLGPMLVASAAGPLDLFHVRGRAYSRMAYNAGNRVLAALLAAVVFGAVHDTSLSTPAARFALAALAASAAFAAVDLACYVGFEHLRSGTSVRVAVRDDLFLDSLTLPLGMLGALAGWLAVAVGWWAAALVLVASTLTPELVVVHARRAFAGERSRLVAMRAVSLTLAAVLVAATVAVAPSPDITTAVALIGIALLLALELRVDRRVPVAPLCVVGVVAALVVARGATLVSAVLVAVVATVASWLPAREQRWWPALLAGLAAVAAVAVFALSPTAGGALAAAIAFEIVVATNWSRLLWSAPLVCAAVAGAQAWRAIGHGGALVFAVALAALGASAGAWGAPPWHSRLLAAWGARRRGACRITLVLAAVASGACGVTAVLVDRGLGLWVAGAAALAASAVALSTVGVRQWSFVPTRRRRALVVLLSAAVVVLLGYPPLALGGDPWSLVVLAGVLSASVVIGWPIARRIDRATAREPVGDHR